MNYPLDTLDEEELAALPPPQEIPETSEEALRQAFNLDPNVLAAREQRDSRIADATLAQGLSEIGAAIASQGRVKASTTAYDAIKKAAEAKADETQKDVGNRTKVVSDFIRAQAMAGKAKEATNRSDRNYQLQLDRLAQEKRANDIAEGRRQEKETYDRKQDEEKKNKPSDAQALAAGYGRRMEQAERDFEEVAKGGFDRTALKEAAVSQLPGVVQGFLPKGLEATGAQRQEQAEKNFLSAVLRRESGASISPTERSEGATQYFPRAGDSPETLAQKKRNRDQAMESLKVSSGPAWDKTPTVGPAKGNQVKRKTKDGRTAIFDGNTKQFLRYE
jgi:hypothetical protein